VKPRRLLLVTALGAGLLAGPVRADDGPVVPPYEAPAAAPALSKALADAVDRAVRTVLVPASPDAAAAEVRRLAGIGAGALPRIAAALREAPWRARASLVSAVAEMDAPEATPLLTAASGDPSFAVREAAVVGLGKTGTAAAAIVARTSPETEPAWRVRAAAATALRRGILRGVVDRGAGAAALVRLLDDPDPDVARAALAACGPLALPEAMTRLVARFTDHEGPAQDRALALSALRAYRDASPELLAALRRGFLDGSDAAEAVRAARALLDVRGLAVLEDSAVEAAVLRHLMDEAARDMREALVALGPPVRPWLEEHTRAAARRVAAAREEPGESPFEPLLDALFQADESAGVDVVREVLAGPGADALHVETRRVALRKAQFGFAGRMRAELRALVASPAGQDLFADALRAVAASGGDDVAAYVETALLDRRADVRAAGLDVLDRFRNVPAPAALTTIAESSERPRERVRALAILGRRDPATAARIARPLLTHPDPSLRDAAIGELGNSRDPAVSDVLRKRLRDEDGRSSHAAPTGDTPPPPPAATTMSDEAETADRVRRTLRSALVRALHRVAGDAAKPDLVALATGDADAKVRETAIQELHGLVTAADAASIASRIGAEPDDAVRDELERLLATLGDAPEAVTHFARQVADGSRRTPALRLLAEPRSRVVPDGLAAGLADPAWNDDERVSALRILERAGRVPPVADLAALATAARTLDLCSESVRALAANASPAAVDELARLLSEGTDPARRSLAARGIGERRATSLAPLLVELLDACRGRAIAADSRTSPDVQLYRECAIALGRLGTDDAAATLVEHLLDPALAAAGARRSVQSNGPFQPEEGAVVTILRTLVAAVAHVDDAALARRFETALERRAADGSQWMLDESYVDGIARYLSDPMAYDLPARRRTAAALPLRLLAARTPPRWSSLDADSWKGAAGELETQGRFDEARAAFAAGVAAADVEDAARSREDRLWETGKLVALRAREADAAGRKDEAVALAGTIRAADPSNGDLAYLHGWCLVKLGRPGPEAAESLRAALARDARDANAQFFLAWIAETTDGPVRSIPLWEEAMRNDGRRVQDFSPSELISSRRGRPHRWGHFPYWLARALASAGRDEAAAAALRSAIRLDDRFGAQSIADPAFAGFADRAAFVAGVLATIPDEPTGASGDALYPQAE
jgi:HEAT repeat protein